MQDVFRSVSANRHPNIKSRHSQLQDVWFLRGAVIWLNMAEVIWEELENFVRQMVGLCLREGVINSKGLTSNEDTVFKQVSLITVELNLGFSINWSTIH